MSKKTNGLIILTLFILLQKNLVHCHTFLLQPRPIVDGFEPNGCVGYSCMFCPREYSNIKRNNSPEKPEGVWKRGQKVLVRWAKNNHLGGFVRVSFVPLKWKNDPLAHELLAFYYGCWVQGRHQCKKGELCGGDKTNSALQRLITVPSYIPDGVYIFSFTWYGGLDFSAKKAIFADYPSCSYVRIEGGEDLIDEFQPFFEAGPLDGNNKRKGCDSFIDQPYVCTSRPLTPECASRPPFFGVPRKFKNGGKPAKICRSSFTDPLFNPRSAPKNCKARNGLPKPNNPSNPPNPSNPSNPSSPSKGVCANKVCCANSCGVCEIKYCATREGGRNNCCPKRIERRGRFCDDYPPPCIITNAIPTPPNSICDIKKSKVCCTKSCGKCNGEKDCKNRKGGSKNCCPSEIRRSNRKCDKESAPCTLSLPPPIGICTGKVCCPKSCTKCGGKGCKDRPGGGESCCLNKIRKSGRLCTENLPPCILR